MVRLLFGWVYIANKIITIYLCKAEYMESHIGTDLFS